FADLCADLRGLRVALPYHFENIGRDPAGAAVFFNPLDELLFGREIGLEQPAGFLNERLALVHLLNGHAVFLGLVAHRQELLADGGRRLRRTAETGHSTGHRAWP